MRMLKLFSSDERGNVAIITAGSMGVLLMLGAGATDIARVNKVRSSMQSSADATLITALRLKKLGWGKRTKFAKEFFEDNFSHPKMVSNLQSRLTGKQRDKKLIFRFETSAKITQLLPDGLSISHDTVHVTSIAEISARTRFEPQLISDPDKNNLKFRSSNL